MTREERIEQKAKELGQNCFPDERNIWARENVEAKCVEHAFIYGAKWADEHPKEGLVSIDKVCEWLRENIDAYSYVTIKENSIPEIVLTADFEHRFRKAMEG